MSMRMYGPQLRRLRRTLGWTQATLATELGVHPNTVARWERGVLTISNATRLHVYRVVRENAIRRASDDG